MNIEKCSQQITGTCNGCEIYAMAKIKSDADRNNIDVIMKRIAKVYCPKGTVMQPIERPKPSSIW